MGVRRMKLPRESLVLGAYEQAKEDGVWRPPWTKALGTDTFAQEEVKAGRGNCLFLPSLHIWIAWWKFPSTLRGGSFPLCQSSRYMHRGLSSRWFSVLPRGQSKAATTMLFWLLIHKTVLQGEKYLIMMLIRWLHYCPFYVLNSIPFRTLLRNRQS